MGEEDHVQMIVVYGIFVFLLDMVGDIYMYAFREGYLFWELFFPVLDIFFDFCFPASLRLCFLPLLLLCFSCFSLFCFPVFLFFSLLRCFSTSLPFYFYLSFSAVMHFHDISQGQKYANHSHISCYL